MKRTKENGLMMEEIGVKNLQEITGGAVLEIISQPIPMLTGVIARPFPIPPRTTGLIAPVPLDILK